MADINGSTNHLVVNHDQTQRGHCLYRHDWERIEQRQSAGDFIALDGLESTLDVVSNKADTSGTHNSGKARINLEAGRGKSASWALAQE